MFGETPISFKTPGIKHQKKKKKKRTTTKNKPMLLITKVPIC